MTPADVLAGRSEWCCVLGDGIALVRGLPKKAVDHTITDPPYDEQTHENARTNRRAKGAKGSRLPNGGNDILIEFKPAVVEAFAPELVRVSKRWILCFCTGAMLGDYKRAVGGSRSAERESKPRGAWVRDGYWHRTNGTPQITGDRPGTACEALAIMHHPGGKKAWNRGGAQAFWAGPRNTDPSRNHPTPKPDWLCEALIRDFTQPGDIILDPFAGEGPMGVACMRLRRRYIGAEIVPAFHESAMRRIARAASGLKQMDLVML